MQDYASLLSAVAQLIRRGKFEVGKEARSSVAAELREHSHLLPRAHTGYEETPAASAQHEVRIDCGGKKRDRAKDVHDFT